MSSLVEMSVCPQCASAPALPFLPVLPQVRPAHPPFYPEVVDINIVAKASPV